MFFGRSIGRRAGIVSWGGVDGQKEGRRRIMAVVTGLEDDAEGQFVLKR